MSRKLIIDGNAVYDLDEECMLRRRLDKEDKAENINGGCTSDHRHKTDGYTESMYRKYGKINKKDINE